MTEEEAKTKWCLPRPRRPWRAEDDAWLRRFHAEGKTDVDIGEIIDRDRQQVRLHRHKLGLPANCRRTPTGWSHTPEAKAKMAAQNRKRWENTEYRAKGIERMKRANEIRLAKMFRAPERGTEAFKVYRKIRTVLGPQAAREQLSAAD